MENPLKTDVVTIRFPGFDNDLVPLQTIGQTTVGHVPATTIATGDIVNLHSGDKWSSYYVLRWLGGDTLVVRRVDQAMPIHAVIDRTKWYYVLR